MEPLLPIHVEALQHISLPYTIDSVIHVFWVLRGEMSIQKNMAVYHIHEDQLTLVNHSQPFCIFSGTYETLDFQINLSQYKEYFIRRLPEHFAGDFTGADGIQLNILKNHMAHYIQLWASKNAVEQMQAEALAIHILSDLCQFFTAPKADDPRSDKMPPAYQRIYEINRYIQENYARHFTLKDISGHFYISPQYIARLYKDTLHMSFFTYVNQVRLSHAIRLIQTSSVSLEDIADQCGFSNVRAMSACFKEAMHTTPGLYRKQHTLPKPDTATVFSDAYESVVLHYMDMSKYTYTSAMPETKKLSVPAIDIASVPTAVYPAPYRIICISDAVQLIYQPVQKMLSEIQADMSFTHIRIQRLLSDQMKLYYENPTGFASINYIYIDTIFDFLYDQRIAPYILLDSLPEKMKKNELFPDEPKSKRQWQYLLTELIRHCEIRYGKVYVNSWIISIGANVDIQSFTTWPSIEEFYEFYHFTFNVLRRLNPHIRLCTPTIAAASILESTWLEDFMSSCHRHGQCPDILTFNLFPIVFDSKRFSQRLSMIQSENPDEQRLWINKIFDKIHRQNWNFHEIIIVDWNFSLGVNYLNDTMFRAAYTIKNILANQHRHLCYSCCSLSDFIENSPITPRNFFGAMGIYTQTAIKKPVYYAWQYLFQTGSDCYANQDYYYVTKSGENIQILLYYYVHYSKAFIKNQDYELTDKNRYTQFEEEAKLTITLPICCDQYTKYAMTESILNCHHGSAFDTWVNTDFIALDTRESINFIKSISVPFTRTQTISAKSQTLQIQATLEPLEIRIINLRPIE